MFDDTKWLTHYNYFKKLSDYQEKLEFYDSILNILEYRNNNELKYQDKNIVIFTENFDIEPKSKEEWGKLYHYVYSRIDKLIEIKRGRDVMRYQELNKVFQSQNHSKIDLYNIDALKLHISERLIRKPSQKDIIIESEVSFIKTFVFSEASNFKYVRESFDSCLKGNEVKSLFQDIYFGLEYLIGIKIGETLADYIDYLLQLQQSKKRILNQEYILTSAKKLSDLLVTSGFIGKEHVKQFQEIVLRNHSTNNEKIVWKKSIADMLSLCKFMDNYFQLNLGNRLSIIDFIQLHFSQDISKPKVIHEEFQVKGIQNLLNDGFLPENSKCYKFFSSKMED